MNRFVDHHFTGPIEEGRQHIALRREILNRLYAQRRQISWPALSGWRTCELEELAFVLGGL
jgi:hypothetical protein